MIVLGNKDLLHEKLAVILNSSQSKIPCGNDSWIVATSAALTEICCRGWTVITSLGLATWELGVYLTNQNRGSQIIIDPNPPSDNYAAIFERVISDFELDPGRTAMLFLKPPARMHSPKATWQPRDLAAVSLAQAVFPISIRPGGRLEKLLISDNGHNKIDSRFKVAYKPSLLKPPKYDIKQADNIFPAQGYIAHWTRTCHGPWPGQRHSEYYRGLLSSGNRYPGNAFETLARIAREKKIRASSRKIREGRPAVGFSALALDETLHYLRWCPKRVNWNFEPYGVVLPVDLADRMGIRPVIYGTDKEYDGLPDMDKPYFQNQGIKNVDWRIEHEWRREGDLDLSQLPEEKITYFAWNGNEAEILRNLTGNDVFAFCSA